MNSEDGLIVRAVSVATRAHEGQVRQGAPPEAFIYHPLRVAQAVADAGGSPYVVAAALLHDVIEDTPVTVSDLLVVFPPAVVGIVQRLTKTWSSDLSPGEKTERLMAYYAGILTDPEALLVKLFDRADNLRTMATTVQNPRWAARYLKKTEAEFPPLTVAARQYGSQPLQVAVRVFFSEKSQLAAKVAGS